MLEGGRIVTRSCNRVLTNRWSMSFYIFFGVVEIGRQKTEQDRQFPGKMACCADDGASLAYAVELMQARTRIVGVGETKKHSVGMVVDSRHVSMGSVT